MILHIVRLNKGVSANEECQLDPLMDISFKIERVASIDHIST